MKSFSLLHSAVIFWILNIQVVHAQTFPVNPAVDEWQREVQRNERLREAQQSRPDVRLDATGDGIQALDGAQTQSKTSQAAPPHRLPVDESPCFLIQKIILTAEKPNEAISFDWALPFASLPDDPALGQCLGTKGINLVMARIQEAIVAKGYLTTRVLALPQDLRNGVLELTAIPGKVGVIHLSPTSNPRANAFNAVPIKLGDVLNLRDIEQGLENFKRLPSVQTDIQIVPGAEVGTSDLLIDWQQAFPFRVNASINDGGSKSTGKYLGTLTVSADHLFMLNDLFYVSGTRDITNKGKEPGRRGTQSGTVHYDVPYDYWLFGVTASRNDYHQNVAGNTQNYRYSGQSTNHELRLEHLLTRNTTSKTTAVVRGYLTQSKNFIDDTEIAVQRRRMAGWELGLHRVMGLTLSFGL